MKRALPFFLISVLLASCNGWIIQPLPGNPPTPFLPFTQTPSVFSPTPVIIGVTSASSTPIIATLTASTTPFPSQTSTAAPITLTLAPTSTFTPPPPVLGLSIKVLGCDTSIDIVHGMGEVTNAYVTLKNTGGIQLTNVKTTLNVLDPGQQTHPDQTITTTTLPIGYQVTIKLTADSTYKAETPIQVKVVSDQGEFPLEGLASCTDIGVGAPKPAGLNTPVPAAP
jgi:hypothetical protein